MAYQKRTATGVVAFGSGKSKRKISRTECKIVNGRLSCVPSRDGSKSKWDVDSRLGAKAITKGKMEFSPRVSRFY